MNKNKVLGFAVLGFIVISALMFWPKSESSIRASGVKLVSGRGGCSGEQIRAPSGTNYILTAAHCKVLEADGSIQVVTENGRSLLRKVIAEDPESDLLLIEGVPGIPALDIAQWAFEHDHIRTFTHGKLHDLYKTEGELLETKEIQVLISVSLDGDTKDCDMPKNKKFNADLFGIPVTACLLDVSEIATNAQIYPGSSGGMVVNDSGELVGVVSAGDGNFGFLVTLYDIQRFTRSY
jgi:hypothetical protein